MRRLGPAAVVTSTQEDRIQEGEANTSDLYDPMIMAIITSR